MRPLLLALLLAALLAMTGLGQRSRFQEPEEEGPRPVFPSQAEFHFVRVEYTDLPEYHRFFGFASRGAQGEGWWVVDWPDADDHFSQGVERLTRVATGDPRHMRFTDDRLFDYPWVYATQTGWWNLSDAETARLREYLLRGGFLVVDDFWGADQWEIFRETMARVLPGIRSRIWPKQIRRCTFFTIFRTRTARLFRERGICGADRAAPCACISRRAPCRRGARCMTIAGTWWWR